MGKVKPARDLQSEKPAAQLWLPGEAPFAILAANTFFKRFMGLMGRREADYGLFLDPCDSIHMFFMRFPIDAVFVDNAGTIVSIHRNLKPGHFALGGKGSRAVLELPASRGFGARLAVGTRLPMKPMGEI
jgi:uncharacterized membrane protein (UPF0127 family)